MSKLDPHAGIPSETRRWEELDNIRSLPIPLAAKRELKAQLASIPMLKLRGWKRWRWFHHRFTQVIQTRITQRVRNIVFMQRSLQNIEVRCGTSVVNVFLYIKWTAFLNLWIFVIIFFFLLVPVFVEVERVKTFNETCPAGYNASLKVNNVTWDPDVVQKGRQLADCCTKDYDTESENTVYHSPLVYGYYHIDAIKMRAVTYDYSLAYALVPILIFGFCLIILVHQIGVGIKETVMSKEGEFYKYSNLIFSGWDHYTQDLESAKFKKKILQHEMKLTLRTETERVEKVLRTRKQKWNLFFARILANLLVLAIQVVAGVIIFYISDFSIKSAVEYKNFHGQGGGRTWHTEIRELGIRILPSLCISLINIVFPALLRHIGKLEKYSRNTQMTWILIRTLFIRLLSVTFAGYKYYYASYCHKAIDTCTFCEAKDDVIEKSACWESAIGIQIYLLVATDFTIKCITVLGIANARRLLAKHFEHRFFKRLGKMKFNVVRHSLDIVYVQCLAWFFYFAPFIPLCTCIYCVCVFYLKRFAVLVNCRAVPDTYRTARSTTIFLIAKLISFAAATIVIVCVLNYLEPSNGCGPFRAYRKAWDAVRKTYVNKNTIAYKIVQTMSSPGVTTPLAIILLVVAYYYYAIAQANKNMVESFRQLLILEGHDKQYLFSRLSALRRSSTDSLVSVAPSSILNDRKVDSMSRKSTKSFNSTSRKSTKSYNSISRIPSSKWKKIKKTRRQ